MKLKYKNYLNSYARQQRQAGNLSEVILWQELKQNKLGTRFLRQRPIGDYIVDFYCYSLNLAIEIDGSASHDGKIEKDEQRQRKLEAIGINIIRFQDKDVRYNLQPVVEKIKQEILRLSGTSFKKGGINPPARKLATSFKKGGIK